MQAYKHANTRSSVPTCILREQRFELQQYVEVGVGNRSLRAAFNLFQQRDFPSLQTLREKGESGQNQLI